VLAHDLAKYKGKVSLILTSPPFPLNRKKRYGNFTGEEYRKWLATFALIFRDFLKPRGSIVIEIGNAWEAGQPSMSTLGLEALIDFRNAGRLTLCQQFVWYNPTKLPTPVQWVNIKRNRVKDSFTHIWWMAKGYNPVANNRRVLVEYSDSMKNLLARQSYNSGLRPSQHNIGERSFLNDNGGAIPSNVLTVSNSSGTDQYQAYCRKQGLSPHPSRMPSAVPEFFINFLTRPGDIVLDPFAGSNTTGAAAEALGRKWLAVEADDNYIRGSRGRFG
jgi:site-specific DNA-methyltransferase (cytosine-N4-specific)